MKSKIQEKHTLSVEGVLNNKDMTIEVEEIGTKKLSELMTKFDGNNVKFSMNIVNEITE